MVKTRHRGDLNDDSEEEFISLRHRSTRRHPVVKPEANGFDGYTDGHDEDDSISTDYGSGLGTHRKAATAVVSSRPRRTRRSHELREVEEDEDEELVHQEPVRKKSSPKSPINAIPRRRTRRYTLPETTDDNTEEDEEEQQRPRKYSLQRSSPQSCKKRVSHEDNSIRRSTRQKKLLYGTFNQSLIVKHQMLMGDEGGDEEEVEEDREHDRRKRKRSSEVEPTPEQDGLDMYSRVKRTRRQVKREIYGMPVTESAQEENSSSSDSSEEEEEEESEEEEANEGRTYHLRVHKPRTNLYEAPPIVSQKRVSRGMLRGDTPPRHAFNSAKYRSPAHKSPRFRSRKRPAFHGSSSTSSSSGSESDDERQFERRKAKSMARNRNRCLPMNFTGEEVATGVMRDRTKIGTSLADVDPMSVDKSVTFESVGGLGKHIRSLKEMIVFPLLYPEVFERFKITPPRGVLFYGPPGTGKTLVARALANECSNENRKVAFFMRKGADCLSKWVGESERQLRLLFDQAYQMRPSIIFFDEIDGLAPVRSSRQDQIHSSIVSTLLALMDGLDNRGEIVIIGATNRLDSIDPALRRPGRFDREFLFPLPTVEARKQILQINTKEWNPKLCDSFLSELSEHCVGYCGADLKALCTEGALHALRRRYPQIYTSEDKLELDVSAIEVQARDFHKAMQCIVPASQRSVSSPGHALDKIIRPLLANALQQIIIKVQGVFPLAVNMSNTLDTPVSANATSQSPVELCSDDEDEGVHPIFEVSGRNGGKKRNSDGDAPARSYLNFMQSATQRPLTYRPRVLLSGQHGQGQSTHLGPAVLHQLERVPVHVLDLPSLYAVTAHTPEEACAQVFREARRTSPSILYMPHIGEWWHVINETLQATFMALLYDLDPSTPIMLVATSEMCYAELPRQIKSLFCDEDVMSMKNPTETERRDFFEDLLLHQIKKPPSTRKVAASRVLEVLPKAKPIEPRKLTESELKSVQKQEEKHLRELRLFLRDILTKLGRDRKFAIFAKPVDTDDVPDYYEIITNPMDLSTMMTKIDLHQYEGVKEFLEDINCICSNALEYNPDRDSAGRAIRHRACALRDTCQALIEAELDPEFEKICNEVREARRRRGELPTATVPSFYYTKPIQRPGTAPGSQAAYPARFCRRGAALEDDLGTTPEQMTDTGPKIRAIVRKVRVISAATKKKSPWCRPTRRHYRKVIVYVDEFGNEVPPPDSVDRKDGAKDAQQDEDGHDTDKTIEMDKEDEVGTISPAKDQTGEMAEDKACLGSNSSATCSTRPSRRGHIDVTQGLNTSVEYKCKVRAVIKRVKLQPSSATRDMNRKKSPWCRTRRKSRFKTMIVYIDEFGNEVPPPPGATGRKNGTKDCEPGKDEVIEYNKMDKSKQMDIDSKVKASETAIEEKENKPLTNAPNSPSRSRPTSPNAMPKLRSASGPSRPGRSPVPSGILMRSTSPHSTSLHSTHTDLPTETPHRLQQSGIPRAALAMEVKPQRRRSSRCSGHGASEAMEIISQMSPTEKTVECAPPEQLASQSNLAVSPTSNPSSSAISKGLPPPHTTSPPQPASAPSTSTPSPEKAASPPAADTTTTNEAPTENRPVENAEKSASPKMRMTRSKSQVPAAVEALAKQVLEAEVPISVIIDDDTLSFLLAKTVRTTENATVEHLEKVYCRLSQAIFSHRDQIDKTQLVQDLEQIISSVSTNHHSSA